MVGTGNFVNKHGLQLMELIFFSVAVFLTEIFDNDEWFSSSSIVPPTLINLGLLLTFLYGLLILQGVTERKGSLSLGNW